MAEIIISIAAKVAEYLLEPTMHHGQYLFCVRKILKNLEKKKEELTLTRNSVQLLVAEAKKKTEKIEKAVEDWLNEVNKLMTAVENLEQKMRANNSCFRGWCPNWRRYHLCKKMAKMIETMTTLDNRSKFNQFSCCATLPGIEYFSSGDFMYFESTKLAYNQLLEAVQDDRTYIIGLYGMGGSGKTTLVKEVGKKAKELNLFDWVLLVTVSQTVNIRSIQGELADMLKLKLEEESNTGRAQRLWLRLKNEKRVLVILDDVWAKLKLEDIGIPYHSNHEGLKVLLTTRRQQVCTLMDCQKKIPLDLLSEEEAWRLFQKHARLDDDCFKLLNGVAQEVARECRGLPIAIEAVGTSLKGKFVDEWKVALKKLRDSKPVDVEEGVKDIFACLQLSYDYLRSKEAKLLFLLCSMFPEDHEISIEELFRYGIGLGLCGEVDSFETARSQVNVGIPILVDSCLLSYSNKRIDHLKMHDMVHDVALWLASKEDCTIMVNHAKELNALVENGDIKDCYAVSSWYKEIDRFPHHLHAPKLDILVINSGYFLDLSHVSFEGAKGLKVLAIINEKYFNSLLLSLPQSIQWLTNLHTLQLVGRELGDISYVVNLVRLEILDLRGSKFKELPNGLEKLKKLKLLDLSECKADDSYYKVIGRCSQLEELYYFNCYPRVDVPYECFLDNVTFRKLQRHILQIGQFKSYLDYWDLGTRVLVFEEFNISNLGAIFKDLLQRATAVDLGNLHGGCKSIFPEIVQAVGGMNELTELSLDSCLEIECLINTAPGHSISLRIDDAFPMLVKLTLKHMDNLKEVCHGPPLLCFFQKLEYLSLMNCRQLHSIFPRECNLCNLKILTIVDCPKLASLFPMSIARSLQLLEKLDIARCSLLKQIVIDEGHNGNDQGEQISPDSDNSGSMFPELRVLSIGSCHQLEYVFPAYCAQGLVQLQQINIENVSELKYIFDQHEQQIHNIFPGEWKFSNLKTLRILSCPKIESLFPISVAQTLLLLQELTIEHCTELKQIIFNEGDGTGTGGQNNSGLTFPELKFLFIRDCHKLKCIFPVSCTQGLKQLQELIVENAYDLKYVFGRHDCEDHSTYQSDIKFLLPLLKVLILKDIPSKMGLQAFVANGQQLNNEVSTLLPATLNVEKLTAQNCGVENIFHLQGVGLGQDQQELIPSKLKSLVLENLPNLTSTWMGPNLTQMLSLQCLQNIEVHQCGKLKFVFSAIIHKSLPELTRLIISNCEEMEEIFVEYEESQNISNASACFPKLKELKVKECNKLKFIFSIAMARMLPQLSSLCISEATQLEEVFRHTSGDGTDNEKEIILPNLRELKLDKLAGLIDICQGFRLNAVELRKVHIHKCPKFAPILQDTLHWKTEGQHVAVSNGCELNNEVSTVLQANLSVEHLSIRNCGVTNIFHHVGGGLGEGQTELMTSKLKRLVFENLPELRFAWTSLNLTQTWSLQHLQYMKLNQCGKLKFVFSAVICRSLPQLTQLIISNCEELEEIIVENEEPQNLFSGQACFPKLEELLVMWCNKLKIIFSTTLARNLPRLNSLCISEAAQLEEIFRHKREDSTDNKKEIMLPNLKILRLQKLKSLVDICQGFKLHAAELCKVHVHECPKFGTHYWKTQGLHTVLGGGLGEGQQKLMASKLKKLVFENLPELRFTWTGLTLTQILTFQHLQYMELNHCGKLKFVFSVVIHQSLPQLRHLSISNCNELEEIFVENEEPHKLSNTQACFSKLRKLKVTQCNKLKIIFSVTVARMLPKLNSLCISEAAQLEEVFRHTSQDGTGIERQIILPNLRKIKLMKLPSLVDVCKGFKLHAVELSKVHIHECPKFTSISEATLNWRTEGLERTLVVNGSQLSNEAPAQPPSILNCVVDMFHIKGVGLGDDQNQPMDSKVVRLNLEHEIWTGPIPTEILKPQFLRCLEVNQCGKLKSVFSIAVVYESLSELTFLMISDCEELEEIIAGKEEPQNLSKNQVCFPKLRQLQVVRCNKLKTLFSMSMARMLPQLELLCVSDAAQLERIFGHKSGDRFEIYRENIVLTNLRKLKLSKLPSIVGFLQTLMFPNLSKWDIHECPNLKYFPKIFLKSGSSSETEQANTQGVAEPHLMQNFSYSSVA